MQPKKHSVTYLHNKLVGWWRRRRRQDRMLKWYTNQPPDKFWDDGKMSP